MPLISHGVTEPRVQPVFGTMGKQFHIHKKEKSAKTMRVQDRRKKISSVAPGTPMIFFGRLAINFENGSNESYDRQTVIMNKPNMIKLGLH